MLRIALVLVALMIAVMPAAFGLLQNASFTREAPVRVPERSIPVAPEPMRPDPEVDERRRDGQDRESTRGEPRRAHNEG